MKKEKKLRLPSWIIKNIQHGEEENDLCSIVVGMIVYSLLGILAFFIVNPFELKHLTTQILCVIVILSLIVAIGFWITSQIGLLKILREKALIEYRNSKTDEEVKKAHLKLQKLNVSTSKHA